MMAPLVFTLTTRIWQLAAINLTALGLIVLGLGIFGLAPACAATFWGVARLNELSAGQLSKGMWREYRAEFMTANVVVLPMLLVCVACLAMALLLPMLALLVLLPLAWFAAAYALSCLFAISCLRGSITDALSNAYTAFWQAPLRLLALVVVLPAVGLLAGKSPLLFVYFGLSAPAFFTCHLLSGALASAMPCKREILQ